MRRTLKAAKLPHPKQYAIELLPRQSGVALSAPRLDSHVQAGKALQVSWRPSKGKASSYRVHAVRLRAGENITSTVLRRTPAYTKTVKASKAARTMALDVPLGRAAGYAVWVTAHSGRMAVGHSDIIRCIGLHGLGAGNNSPQVLHSRSVTCPVRGSIQMLCWNTEGDSKGGDPRIDVDVFGMPSESVDVPGSEIVTWPLPRYWDNVPAAQQFVKASGVLYGDFSALSHPISPNLRQQSWMIDIYGNTIPPGSGFPSTLSYYWLWNRQDQDFYRFLPDILASVVHPFMDWGTMAPWSDSRCPGPYKGEGLHLLDEAVQEWLELKSEGDVDEVSGGEGKMSPGDVPPTNIGQAVGPALNYYLDWTLPTRKATRAFRAWAGWSRNCPIRALKVEPRRLLLRLRALPDAIKAVHVAEEKYVHPRIARALGHRAITLLPGDYRIDGGGRCTLRICTGAKLAHPTGSDRSWWAARSRAVR